MLVLSRKEKQRIKLGDSIVVTVIRVAGDKVRLGIEAPDDMLVLREELDIGEHPIRKSEPTLAAV
ncbi:MAG: carbon storage regulator [Planctomycetes bacterium]|nr:carbon storage regulator [Planctomycetota bacterium]